MGIRGRWLIWLVPLGFLGLVPLVAWYQDHDFWHSTSDLYALAREAASRRDHTRALELARKAWLREPGNPSGLFLGQLFLETGQLQEALEVGRLIWTHDRKAAAALAIQALALEMLAQRQEAQEILASYLKEKPEDQEVLQTAAAIAARRPEDHPLAAEYYRRLYQLSPEPQVRRRLLELLVGLSRYEEAISLQEEEAAQFPGDQEALHRLALLHYWHRDYQAAALIYQRLLERAAEDAALRLEAAKNAEAAKETDQALAHYLWLYGRHQGKKEFALALARLWSQKGNHAEAAGVLAPLARKEADPELKRWCGLELLLTGDFVKSLQSYEAAWKAGDTHQETIVNLARLQARKGQFARAAGFWDEAVRRQLLDGDLRWEAALTYSYARRFQEALEVLQPLSHQNHNDPKLLLFRGQLHFYQKHWGQAAQAFKAYLAINSGDVEVRRQLAEALSFEPETREPALEQYAQVLKVKDDPALRLRRIHLLLEDNRWGEAAGELKGCPEPQEPRLLRQQAHLYLWLGDLDEALKYYDLFLRRLPQDQAGRLEKARVLTYLGRIPEALELLSRLRQELPRDPAVRVAAVEAYLSARDFPKALTLARNELEPLPELGLDERALVARCYFHGGDPRSWRRAAELLLKNLRQNRHHHPTLLILAAVLPHLPRYEDLNRVMDGIPGLALGGQGHASSLAYFDGILGRQGGKLSYLLHVLEENRRHKWPDNPGKLLGLGWLAMELGERHSAAAYYQRALNLRPGDPRIAAQLLQCQMSQKDWSSALASLKKQGGNPAATLEMARIYLMRGQYEGVKAMAASIPSDRPEQPSALLLTASACRLEGNYPEALKTLAAVEGKIPRADWLMEKARLLEAMGDKRAAELYAEIAESQPASQAAKVARARQARAQSNWVVAYKAYGLALQDSPQDVELLNELEQIRQQMRPQVASRGFRDGPGERRPEEAKRAWQFSRFDREPRGIGLTNYLPGFLWDFLPVVQPESLGFTDSNKLYGGIFRLSSGFWINKVLPVQLGAEYREYNQRGSRLRRGEVSLEVGPVAAGDRLRITGEIIGRRYWRRQDGAFVTQEFFPFPEPHFLPVTHEFTEKEDRNRLLGSLEIRYQATPRTDVSLKFSRRDIFDQDAHLYPRLYQGVLNLEKARITTLDQVDLSFNHQCRPGLDWRGNLGGAFFADDNRRLTLYQGLAWQAVNQPRMLLEFTPHFYLASYAQSREAYFSPHQYSALGLGVDFRRQLFRLPTLILQGTAQGVGQHGQWGPALQGVAALEWEWIHNFYTDLHIFYFREWVDNYRLLNVGISCRWRF
jgi:tetratricopeptide (TPR) repeat protein